MPTTTTSQPFDEMAMDGEQRFREQQHKYQVCIISRVAELSLKYSKVKLNQSGQNQVKSNQITSIRNARYATDTISTVVLLQWRTFDRINYWTRKPWQHLLLFLQSDATKHGNSATNLSVMACGKSGDIISEWDNLLDNGWLVKFASPHGRVSSSR